MNGEFEIEVEKSNFGSVAAYTRKRVSVMQPYFLPYIGYFQLINASDEFIVYDDVKYTKKGWINRNRYLSNGSIENISIPLKSGSDYLDIRDRHLALDFESHSNALLRRVSAAYRKAPYRAEAMRVLEGIMSCESRNLFCFLLNSIVRIMEYIKIDTNVIVSSAIVGRTTTSGQDRVIDLCQSRGAQEYINPIGGASLYSHEAFLSHNLQLRFLKPSIVSYPQSGKEFVGSLSILDVIMNNSIEGVGKMLLDGVEIIHA
jgi:hypothetical protein